MLWWGLIILIILIAYLIYYQKQVRDLTQQLRQIKSHPTNQLLTQSIYHATINDLVLAMNDSLTEERNLAIQLQRTEQLTQQLMTNLSHDIRTPLTSLSGYVQLLDHAQTDTQRQQYIAIIRERIDRLSEMLDELFIYMKLKDQQYPIEMETIHLSEWLPQHLFTYYHEFDTHEIQPEFIALPTQVYLRGSQTLLARIVDNVVRNVFDHAGKDLQIHLEDIGDNLIRLSFTNQTDYELPVDDQRFQQRFYTDERWRHQSNTGLGLPIVQAAMERLGGEMTIETTHHQFTVHLIFPRVAPWTIIITSYLFLTDHHHSVRLLRRFSCNPYTGIK